MIQLGRCLRTLFLSLAAIAVAAPSVAGQDEKIEKLQKQVRALIRE